ELAAFEVKMQDVELTRHTNVSGLFFSNVVARIPRAVSAPVEVDDGGRTLKANITTDVDVTLSVGMTAATVAPLFTADNPYVASGFSTQVELHARDGGGYDLSFTGFAQDETQPLFALMFGTFAFSVNRAEVHLSAVQSAGH